MEIISICKGCDTIFDNSKDRTKPCCPDMNYRDWVLEDEYNKLSLQPPTISKMENVDLNELQNIIEDCIGHSDLNVIPEGCGTLDEETTALAKNIINSIIPYLKK